MQTPSPRFRSEKYSVYERSGEIIHSGWAPTWRTEINRNIRYRVLLQTRDFIPRGTHEN